MQVPTMPTPLAVMSDAEIRAAHAHNAEKAHRASRELKEAMDALRNLKAEAERRIEQVVEAHPLGNLPAVLVRAPRVDTYA